MPAWAASRRGSLASMAGEKGLQKRLVTVVHERNMNSRYMLHEHRMALMLLAGAVVTEPSRTVKSGTYRQNAAVAQPTHVSVTPSMRHAVPPFKRCVEAHVALNNTHQS